MVARGDTEMEKKRILLVCANPRGTDPLRLAQELACLRSLALGFSLYFKNRTNRRLVD
jgi:hypothetical protein